MAEKQEFISLCPLEVTEDPSVSCATENSTLNGGRGGGGGF